MIQFVYNTPFSLINEIKISDWLLFLASQEGYRIKNLYYNYVSTEEIQFINLKHLNHNYPTDVITFDYSVDDEISAEVFICQEQVEKNAIEYSQTTENETIRVLCHALFHLCGHDDKSKTQQLDMRQTEDKAIASFHTTFK